MKIIVPTNNKGGVGKTKISILLAEYLSLIKRRKVLAIDLDPQCNFSQRFLKMEVDPAAPQGLIPPIHPDYDPDNPEDADWDGRNSIADIFSGQGIVPYPTAIENLDIAPGHADKLLLAEAVRKAEVAEKVHKQLGILLESSDVQAAYEAVIIDTAPSKGPLTVSAIKAATHILIPSLMEEQPIQGVYGMLQLWMQESHSRAAERPLKLLGVLPNMFRPINLHRDMLESLQRNQAIAKYIMPVKLGQRAAFAEVDAEEATPRSIFELPDTNPAKQEAVEFCEFVHQGVFTND